MQERKFPTVLKLWKYEIERQASKLNLPHRDIIYYLVDFEEMSEVVSHHGFPVLPRHWKYGQDSLYWKKYRLFGLGIVYELVINTEPIYGYLLDCNSLPTMKAVQAHVIGHAHLFDHNMYCAKQNRNMLTLLGNDAQWYESQCALHGAERVKEFYDQALSLEDLIDIHASFFSAPRSKTTEERDQAFEDGRTVNRIEPRDSLPGYMDEFLNPAEWVKQEKERLRVEEERERELAKGLRIPREPATDVLGFVTMHAPLEDWQRGILAMIRRQSYYKLMGVRVKGLHEGWASYWEEEIMYEAGVLKDSESSEFNQQMAGVQKQGAGLNPYRLFYDLLRDIRFRWDTGRHGKIWDECTIKDIRGRWDEFMVYKKIREESGSNQSFFEKRWMEFSAFVQELRLGRLGYPKEFFIRDFFLRENLIPAWTRYQQADQERSDLARRLEETQAIESALPDFGPADESGDVDLVSGQKITNRERMFKARRDLFWSKERKDLWSWTSHELEREISAVEVLLRFRSDYQEGKINCRETLLIPPSWEDHKQRYPEPVELSIGLKKIFDVSAYCDDFTFLDEFFTKDFCESHRYFLYKAKKVFDSETLDYLDRYVLESKAFERIKQRLLFRYTNFYSPIIVVRDANYKNRGSLYLRHEHLGVDLDFVTKGGMYITDVLRSFYHLNGKRPVHLESIVTRKEEEKPWWWNWHLNKDKEAPDWPKTLSGKRILFSYGIDEKGKEGLTVKLLEEEVFFPEPF